MRGRLWRMSNPALPEAERNHLVAELMAARRAVRARKPDARARVDAAKRALGERGPPWWSHGAPDWNRHLARNTPYAAWWAGMDSAD